jgi:hypothetical protein
MSFGGGGAAGTLELADEMKDPYAGLLGSSNSFGLRSSFKQMFNDRVSRYGNILRLSNDYDFDVTDITYFINLASEGIGLPWNMEDTYIIRRNLVGSFQEDLIMPLDSFKISPIEGKAYTYEIQLDIPSSPVSSLGMKLCGGTQIALPNEAIFNGSIICGSDLSAGLSFQAQSNCNIGIKSIALYGLTGNPYTSKNAHDPDNEITTIEDAATDYGTQVGGHDHKTDWEGIQDTAKAKADTMFPDKNLSTIFTTIVSDALTKTGAHLNSIYTDLISNGKATSVIANYEAKVSSLINDLATDAYNNLKTILSNIITDINGQAKTTMAGKLLDAKTDILPITSTAIDSANTKTKTVVAGMLAEALSDVDTTIQENVASALLCVKPAVKGIVEEAGLVKPVIDAITEKADEEIEPITTAAIEAALTSAVAALTSSNIDDVVEHFEAGLLRTHLQSVNRFAGGMADINAVQSSAFVIGMALLESDFRRDVSEFRSKMGFELYTKTITEYLDIFKQSLITYLSSSANIAIGYIDKSVQGILEQMSQAAQMDNNYLNQGIGMVNAGADRDVNAINKHIDTSVGIESMYTDTLSKMDSNYYEAYKSIMNAQVQIGSELFRIQSEAYKALFESHFGKQVGVDMETDRARLAIDSLATDAMVKMLLSTRGDYFNVANLIANAAKTKTALLKEQIDRDLEIDYLEGTWDLSLLQVGGSLLASAAGASGYVPNKPTTNAGNVAGQMLTGASAGAAITGGNPIGAGIGAAVGLLSAFGEQP